MEPIRRPIAEKGYKYYEASCEDVDAARKTIVCRAADPTFECNEDSDACPWHTFEVEYDYLVTAVGAVPNTFGVPGVEEHAMFFKEIVHANKFRREVNERFERATLPDVPEERLKELLSFVIIGAGPTGVELAAELYDMVFEDIARMYPSRLMPHVSIKIVDLQGKILSAYDRRIAEYATEFFQRANIECLLNKQVAEVKDGAVVMKDKFTGELEEVPAGLAVWCSGIKLNPLCEKIMDSLPSGGAGEPPLVGHGQEPQGQGQQRHDLRHRGLRERSSARGRWRRRSTCTAARRSVTRTACARSRSTRRRSKPRSSAASPSSPTSRRS